MIYLYVLCKSNPYWSKISKQTCTQSKLMLHANHDTGHLLTQWFPTWSPWSTEDIRGPQVENRCLTSKNANCIPVSHRI